jgi:hypothetical protein
LATKSKAPAFMAATADSMIAVRGDHGHRQIGVMAR